MSHRTQSRLALGIFVVVVLATAGGIVLSFASRSALPAEEIEAGALLADVIDRLQFLSVSGLGALIVVLRPGNRFGWVLVGAGTGFPLWDFFEAYATYGLVEAPGSLPLAVVSAWFTNWVWALSAVAPPLIFLLFPDGRPPTRRWGPAMWLTVVAGIAIVLLTATARGPLESFPDIDNPIGFGAPPEAPEEFVLAAVTLIPLLTVAGVAALVQRYRRADRARRSQLKWFAYAAGMFALMQVLPLELSQTGSSLMNAVSSIFLTVGLGLAIFKHRLYDIDRLINRTLAYGILTAILASTYLLGVLGLQSVLPVSDDSPLIVAASTLGVVAAFGPLRGRIQSEVDRRFNRSRYDAQHTIESFGSRLRDEVDIDSLTSDLAAVVERTMQPAHVSVWIRGASRT